MMSADFWAGYLSGAVGIVVGNPLDILKTKLQAGAASPLVETHIIPAPDQARSRRAFIWTSWLRGAAAPILGYGALNALLFMTYNRSLALLNTGNISDRPSGWTIWTAGALGGLATFFVSAPTELVKCRAQVSTQSSIEVTKALWKQGKLPGLYMGGGITSVRDAVGYGFYFWSYELAKRAVSTEEDSPNQRALKVLLCGGLAGVVTWTSIFPMDALKTRVQTWDLMSHTQPPNAGVAQPLLGGQSLTNPLRPSTLRIAKDMYAAEGVSVFFRGLGICNVRAFIVNAVQWAVYEYLMKQLAQ
ncbi:hypothetical protein LTR56_006534 [Elasticomyces elasticus]|nr:hypothetical protein LTR56_006534 [Elasticomyces elasticus]KAK4931701.1 hypothetical protein LTR49_001766 [Elasticomyces elasticus]KAK5741265.1 hypothetical protein LTS12_024667 [Elasticomyces elasticus]